MVKPIPVFAFVFAAYAATHAPATRERDDRGDNPDSNPGKAAPAPGPAWRSLLRQGADVRVKVGVAENGGQGAARPVARIGAPGDEIEEIWLGQIAETAYGFTGVVAESGAARVTSGQRMRFARIHVLGWTMGVKSTEPARAAQRERAPV